MPFWPFFLLKHTTKQLQQGAKYYWISFRKHAPKIRVPKLFEAFQIEAANLNIDFDWVSSRQKTLSRNWVSNSVFRAGNSVISLAVRFGSSLAICLASLLEY